MKQEYAYIQKAICNNAILKNQIIKLEILLKTNN